MSKDHISIPMVDTSRPVRTKLDINDVEMVFGLPTSPKSSDLPELHIVDDERKHGRSDNNRNKNGQRIGNTDPLSQPLLEPALPPQKPPLAGPEIDDLSDDKPSDNTPFPGIDDGLLEPGVHNSSTPELLDDDDSIHKNGSKDHEDQPETHEEGVETEDGNWGINSKHGVDETDFYYGDGFPGNGFQNRFGEDRPGSPMPIPGSIPDVNTYQQKKNLAQGMMDLALLSANANQLRYVLESSTTHPYFYPSLIFISLSIVLQVMVGVGLIMNSRYNVKDEKDICKADKINNMTVLGIFLITIVNVFITSFSVATPMAAVAVANTITNQSG